MDMTFPFAPLDKYAFPGGYAIVAVMDDGEYLCPDCVNNEENPVHFGGDADGWKIEGIQTTENDETVEYCAHCNKLIA